MCQKYMLQTHPPRLSSSTTVSFSLVLGGVQRFGRISLIADFYANILT